MSTTAVWVRREIDDDSKAEQVIVDSNCTISGLKSVIVSSKIFPISCNADITKVTLDSKEVSTRTTLSSLQVTPSSTFVISVLGTQQTPETPQLFTSGLSSQKWPSQNSTPLSSKVPLASQPAQMPTSTSTSAADMDAEKRKQFFVVMTDKTANSSQDSSTPSESTKLIIVSKVLKDVLRQETGGVISQLYEGEPQIAPHQLLASLPQLKDRAEILGKEHPLGLLVDWLKNEYAKLTQSLESMVSEGFITFSALWYLFPKGSKVYTYESASNCKVGTEVSSFQYKSTIFSEIFVLNGNVLQATGTEFINVQKSFFITEFTGARKISDLSVKLMDKHTFEELTKRGKMFSQIGNGAHHMSFSGTIFRKSWWGVTFFNAEGRVIVDGQSFSRMNPNYRHEDYSGGKSKNNSGVGELVSDANYFKTWPTVLGFSFTSKKWGEIPVNGLRPVTFDEDAFTRLVLPTHRKQLIKALVQNQSATFTDIISGKGGGCIILLHGKPGVGKTLTAEAIAELLHKPLYSVTVGELGTDAKQLESNLREILEVASVWDAVILLDEADIFLEKRTTNQIVRNAMVGIFLRLLEYHQGVLFLTTNRVKAFDKAFHSRISIALHYDDLDTNARVQIWETFLQMASKSATTKKRESDDVTKQVTPVVMPSKEELLSIAEHQLNGRQIKTMVRLSHALATSKAEPLTLAHITSTIDLTLQFRRDIATVSKQPEFNEESDDDNDNGAQQ